MMRPPVSALAVVLLARSSFASPAPAALEGRVVAVHGAPAARAILLADPGGGSPPTSVPVASDGSFHAAGLRPGPIAIAVETDEGLYTVSSPLTLAPGATRSVGLALRGRQDTNTGTPPEKSKKSKNIWNNPLAASLMVIGGAIVLGLAVDQLTGSGSSNTPASASSPTD